MSTRRYHTAGPGREGVWLVRDDGVILECPEWAAMAVARAGFRPMWELTRKVLTGRGHAVREIPAPLPGCADTQTGATAKIGPGVKSVHGK